MTAQARNRWVGIGSLLVASFGLLVFAFGDLGKNLVYYWTPGELLSQGDRAQRATVRLGGIVQAGSLNWDKRKGEVAFRVADGKDAAAPSVGVVTHEVPPQMFREGIGVVVEGTVDSSRVFHAQRLMVNHSNEYRAPKPGEARADWRKTVQP